MRSENISSAEESIFIFRLLWINDSDRRVENSEVKSTIFSDYVINKLSCYNMHFTIVNNVLNSPPHCLLKQVSLKQWNK